MVKGGVAGHKEAEVGEEEREMRAGVNQHNSDK